MTELKWIVKPLFNLGSFWIGIHWSKQYQRWCINLVPCFTICVVKPGGIVPGDKCNGDK